MEKFPSTNMARSLLFPCFSTIMNFFLGCFFKGIYNKVFEEKNREQINICVLLSNEIAWWFLEIL